MKKAINQWAFPEQMPLDRLFAVAADAGYDAVELNLNAAGDAGLTADTTVEDAKQIGLSARQNGISLLSLSTGLLWNAPLSHSDPAVREKGRKIVVKQLQLAHQLQIDTILVVPGTVDKDTPYDLCYQRSREEIGKLLRLAEQYGVCIGIENVWNKFLLSPLEAATYIDELGSPFAAAYFDVGNVLQYGYPEQWIRILNKRIRKIHVKDFNTKVGNINGFVPLLAGDVHWSEVMTALREIGYDDVMTAEVFPYASDSLQLVYDTSRQMDAIMSMR